MSNCLNRLVRKTVVHRAVIDTTDSDDRCGRTKMAAYRHKMRVRERLQIDGSFANMYDQPSERQAHLSCIESQHHDFREHTDRRWDDPLSLNGTARRRARTVFCRGYA